MNGWAPGPPPEPLTNKYRIVHGVVPTSRSDMERDKGRRASTGETAGSPPPRSSLTAFQAYHRSVLLILEDAKLQLPDAYPELVKILAKKLEREM